MKEIIKKAKNSGFSKNPNREKLNDFLLRLFPIMEGEMAFPVTETEKDRGCAFPLPVSKIVPAKESTPTAADVLLSLDGVSNVYFHTCLHRHTREGAFNLATKLFCNNIMVDVDDFPLGKYESPEEKADAVFASYDVLKKLPPSFIIDTGKKGFQAYWVFGFNIKSRTASKTLRNTLALLLGGDTACVGEMQTGRLPYCVREDGNVPEIIYASDKNYDFYNFCGAVYDVLKEYVFTYDGFATDSEKIFEDDIMSALEDYLIDIRGCGTLRKDLRHNWSSEKLTADAKEQSAAVLLAWGGLEEPEKENKKEKKTKQVKSNKLFYINKRKDLFDLIKVTGGELTGYRNSLLYAMTSNEAFIRNDQKHIEKFAADVNKKFAQPLPGSEVAVIVRSVLKSRKNYGEVALGNMFPMLRSMNTRLSYTEEGSRKRKEEAKAEKRRKARAAAIKKKLEFKKRFMKEAAKEENVARLAKTLGKSRPTVYKYLKIYKAEILKRMQAAGPAPNGIVKRLLVWAQPVPRLSTA